MSEWERRFQNKHLPLTIYAISASNLGNRTVRLRLLYKNGIQCQREELSFEEHGSRSEKRGGGAGLSRSCGGGSPKDSEQRKAIEGRSTRLRFQNERKAKLGDELRALKSTSFYTKKQLGHSVIIFIPV